MRRSVHAAAAALLAALPLWSADTTSAFREVAKIFEHIEATSEETATPGSIDVVMVRIAPDGQPIYACVDNEEAAKRFLEAPIEKLARKANEK